VCWNKKAINHKKRPQIFDKIKKIIYNQLINFFTLFLFFTHYLMKTPCKQKKSTRLGGRHQHFVERLSVKSALLTAVTVFALTALVQAITPGGFFSKGISVKAQESTFSCQNVTDVSVTECEALVAIYNATNGANWTDNTNRLADGDTTVCDWKGVECSAPEGFCTNTENTECKVPAIRARDPIYVAMISA
jgi:hypothetical protein